MNMAQIMSFEYMYVRRNNLSLSRLCVGHIKPTTTTHQHQQQRQSLAALAVNSQFFLRHLKI